MSWQCKMTSKTISMLKALLIYAAGTMGKPKGIIYSHTHMVHDSLFIAWQCKMTRKAISRVWALPIYTSDTRGQAQEHHLQPHPLDACFLLHVLAVQDDQ